MRRRVQSSEQSFSLSLIQSLVKQRMQCECHRRKRKGQPKTCPFRDYPPYPIHTKKHKHFTVGEPRLKNRITSLLLSHLSFLFFHRRVQGILFKCNASQDFKQNNRAERKRRCRGLLPFCVMSCTADWESLNVSCFNVRGYRFCAHYSIKPRYDVATIPRCFLRGAGKAGEEERSVFDGTQIIGGFRSAVPVGWLLH